MKRHKVPGLAGVVAKMLQATGNVGTQWTLDLCNGIVKDGCIQKYWKSSVVHQFTKGKGIQWSVDLTEELNSWNM